MKKVCWVTNMYRDWKNFRNSNPTLMNIGCDIDVVDSLNKSEFVGVFCKFLTEVKKLNGSDFPGKTLYDIVICM